MGWGVVEVKCPITLRDGNMSSLDWMVVESDGKFRLRITHQHYYQVQMQLLCQIVNTVILLCGRPKCCT